MTTNYVYVVQHDHELPSGAEDVKLIGVYSSDECAQAAVERARLLEGFRETPLGFHVDRYELDADHWKEGFSSE